MTLKTKFVILVSRCAKKKLFLNVFRKQKCQMKKNEYFLKKGIDIIFPIWYTGFALQKGEQEWSLKTEQNVNSLIVRNKQFKFKNK